MERSTITSQNSIGPLEHRGEESKPQTRFECRVLKVGAGPNILDESRLTGR
jgi:hypothetical protein